MKNELYNSNLCVVVEGDTPFKPHPDWRIAHVVLNSLTFGFAANKEWAFHIGYSDKYTFNVEKPPVSVHVSTPRSAFYGRDLPPDEGVLIITDAEREYIEKVPVGYTFEMCQMYNPEIAQILGDFPKPFFKTAWDVPVRWGSDCGTYLIHPDENRLFYASELQQLFGHEDVYNGIPQEILDYVLRQVSFYENGLWEDYDVKGFYDPAHGWREEETKEKVKVLDWSLLRSEYVHPLSQK